MTNRVLLVLVLATLALVGRLGVSLFAGWFCP
ncbi:hypothetical protein B0I33_111224 [Prauserella shujinwangii]|uniref:Uncharacterized protein n=1 Tax=Prauserella shujinwangii TaxID=1453103 RepID=A0A2T0LNF6_9PSEU|nr:hypothetical protein B0I33_111224 [Prauserella shujinwangii]